MRVRTDEKRREIVEAAAALFVELGYDRTSMSAISERLGGSKATLYGYFPSKEDLLRAVLEHEVTEETAKLVPAFPSGQDLRGEFVELGVRYLANRLSDLPISNFRTVSNQPLATGIGQDFYDNVLRPAWDLLARHFGSLMEAGLLHRADPWVAAMHWRGLIESEVLEKRLLGVIAGPADVDTRQLAIQAADAFLKIYRPLPNKIRGHHKIRGHNA